MRIWKLVPFWKCVQINILQIKYSVSVTRNKKTKQRNNTFTRSTRLSIYNEGTREHSLWFDCWVQVRCLFFPLRTLAREPSCTSASGAPDAACDMALSACRTSRCKTWAERRVREKSCGCRTGWRAGCSAAHERWSGRRRSGSSEWRRRPADRCLCTNSSTLSLCTHTHWISCFCVTFHNKTKLSLAVGAYLMRKVPSGAMESISCASSIVIDPQ